MELNRARHHANIRLLLGPVFPEHTRSFCAYGSPSQEAWPSRRIIPTIINLENIIKMVSNDRGIKDIRL